MKYRCLYRHFTGLIEMNHEKVRVYLPSGRDILVLPHTCPLREQFLLYFYPLSPSHFYLLPSFGLIHFPSLIFVLSAFLFPTSLSFALKNCRSKQVVTGEQKWITSALLRVGFCVFPEAGAKIVHIVALIIVDWWNLKSL
jgi:hypothetical protein